MIDTRIDPEIQILLQFAGEEVLTRTIWSLTPEQKRSQIFKQLGQQRYLSALRSGGIENAEMTKLAFSMDPYFLKSKLVTDAALMGYNFKITAGDIEKAKKIKEIMGLSVVLPQIPTNGQ